MRIVLNLVFITAIFLQSCQPNKNSAADDTFYNENMIREGKINVDGDSIYYKIIGNGEPLILVHGGPGLDHSYFLPQMRCLMNDYQLIFIDQRACGQSDADVDSSTISVKSFINDIDQIRQQLKLGKVNLLGHSWGGLLAMNYAIKYQTNLKTLILLNTMSPSSEYRAQADSILNTRKNEEDSVAFAQIRASEAFKNRESSAYEDFFRVLFRREFFNKKYADSLTLTFPDSFAANSQILQHLGNDLSSYDILSDLNSVEVPTLILYGDYDPLAGIVGQKLKDNIPNSSFVIIPNCGHFPYIESQEEFVEEIRKFKSSIADSPPD